MELAEIKVGTRIKLADGATAVVVAPTRDGLTLEILYEDGPLTGTVHRRSEKEIAASSPADEATRKRDS